MNVSAIKTPGHSQLKQKGNNMLPEEREKQQLVDMYGPERAAAILRQGESADQSTGVETIFGQVFDESLEPGWYLEIFETEQPYRLVRLGIGEHVIGRLPSCNILIGNRAISRIHCLMTVHADGHITLRDMQSTNHIFVNGVQMEPEGRCELKDGDIILATQICMMILTRK